MKASSQRALLFSIVFVMAALIGFSQVIPTGRLVGTITDNEGQGLPGVTVTISSPSLILPQMATTTNNRGFYRFVELPSGTYQVKIEMPLMKTIIRENVIITTGGTVTLDIQMEQSTVEEALTVVGQVPIVDLQGTTTGTNFKELLSSLPTQRTFESVYNLAPGMYDSTSHGSDVRSNKYTVDGLTANRTDDGTSAVKIGFNSIEEIVIDTGGHKAEYGSVRGGVIQVLTKSGGNQFHGEANFYIRHKSLQSDNTKGTPFEGSFVGFRPRIPPGYCPGRSRSSRTRSGSSPISTCGARAPMRSATRFSELRTSLSRTISLRRSGKSPGRSTPRISSWPRAGTGATLPTRTSTTRTQASRPRSGTSNYTNYGMFLSGQWSSIFSQNFLLDLRAGYYRDWNDMESKSKSQNTYYYPEEIQDEQRRRVLRLYPSYSGQYRSDHIFGQLAGEPRIQAGRRF